MLIFYLLIDFEIQTHTNFVLKKSILYQFNTKPYTHL